MPYKDPETRKKYLKEYYKKNKAQAQEYYLVNKDKFRNRNQIARKRNTQFINEYKVQTGCSKCGYNKHPCALDFHHIELKTKNVARLGKDAVSLDSLKEEMSKCIVLCANCHREEHYLK